ncbi:ABC transporter ATP-binding protein [Streptomyces daliensis]
MIQAIGLTSVPRRHEQPAVDDLTFEARAGRVTVLLGPEGAGKTSALRMMLQLDPGRGVALFRGRPMHRIPYPAREIGVLLGDVPGHPSRTARGHLRMLTAVAGVPVGRADDVLDVVGLSGLADQKLGAFSLGMDRRLGVAAALLADPHTLVLDEPAHGLSPREAGWLHGLLRGYAEQGGAVLVTSRDPREAARLAHRVVTLDEGRLVADQEVADFARTRLRPRVAVHTPHAERLATVLSQEARRADRTTGAGGRMEVVREGGSRISVYGSTCAEVGEAAYRHGILVHQLADEIGDAGDVSPTPLLARADGRHARGAVPVNLAASATPATPEAPAASGPREAEVPVPSRPIVPHAVSAVLSSLVDRPSASPDSGHRAARGTAVAPRPGAVAADTGRSPGGNSPSDDGRASASPETLEAPEAPEAPEERGAGSPAREGFPSRPRAGSSGQLVQLPPRTPAVPRPGPVAPLRYELRRLFGVRITWVVLAMALVTAWASAMLLARTGSGADGASPAFAGGALAPVFRLLIGWPAVTGFFLPPSALAAGVLGALAFGHEFRYPALAPAQAPVPRRLGMLVAKLGVSAATAALLCVVTAVVNAATLTLAFGRDVLAPASGPVAPVHFAGAVGWEVQAMAIVALAVGCAWAGLLAAGVFRSVTAGVLAVAAVPLLVAPGMRTLLSGPAGRSLDGLPERLEAAVLVPVPPGLEHWMVIALHFASQPVGRALALSLTALLCAYVFTSLRSRAR